MSGLMSVLCDCIYEVSEIQIFGYLQEFNASFLNLYISMFEIQNVMQLNCFFVDVKSLAE